NRSSSSPAVTASARLRSGALKYQLLDRVDGPMRLDFELSLRPAREGVRAVVFNLSPRNATDPRSPGMGRFVIKRFADAKSPGRKLDGRALRLDEWSYSVDEQKWLRTSS